MVSNRVFQKWDKNKLVRIIQKNGFTVTLEMGGVFLFYLINDSYENSYKLYLGKTTLTVCNRGASISKGLTSYKKLDDFLREIYLRKAGRF